MLDSLILNNIYRALLFPMGKAILREEIMDFERIVILQFLEKGDVGPILTQGQITHKYKYFTDMKHFVMKKNVHSHKNFL